ncbi:MAG: mannanase [candidate division KSB1 bacterium]|nr:mannanase [candidate division KSB1 bacterium]
MIGNRNRALCFLLALTLAACGRTVHRGASHLRGFVRVEGTQFQLDGRRYCFLGTNVWYGVNLGADTVGGDRERLVRELDRLCELGIRNLRIMGASEGEQFNTVRPCIQPEPQRYRETMLRGLDFLLAEMGKRGMRAVIFLNNYWEWSGGMAQYVAWERGVPVPNPGLPQYRWDEFMNFSALFYRDSTADDWYRRYVRHVVLRTNSVTGIPYREDPTIMAWQLANEPRPGWGEPAKQNFEPFAEWIDRTAQYIKGLDPNHLVCTGNEGLVGCNGSEELYLRTHSFKAIDYLTFHLWVLNWSWFDPLRPQETYGPAVEKALDYIRTHIAYAERIGKPLVLEEFGMPRDGHSYDPSAPTTYRDRYYEVVFAAIYENAAAGGPLVGSNFWAWGGEGRPRDPKDPVWRLGDPYTGDPPQEPQGRNSVFDSDESTLSILRKWSGKMDQLAEVSSRRPARP